jgi:hypothetical protein
MRLALGLSFAELWDFGEGWALLRVGILLSHGALQDSYHEISIYISTF